MTRPTFPANRVLREDGLTPGSWSAAVADVSIAILFYVLVCTPAIVLMALICWGHK